MEGDAEDDGDPFSLDHDDDIIDDHDAGGHANEDDDDGILSQQERLSVTTAHPAAAAAAAAGVTAPAAGSSPSSPPVEEEEHMGTDPYNPDDWNKFDLAGGEGEGEGEGEVGFDDDDDPLQYLGFYDDVISESGDNSDSDVDSLADDGLAEVDKVLRLKGRLSVLDPPRAGQKATTTPDAPKLDKPPPQLESGEGLLPQRELGGGAPPQLEGGGAQQQGVVGVKHSSVIELAGHSHSARGTGAQAATSLKSAAAPGGVNLASRSTGGPSQPATTTSHGAGGGSTYHGQNNNRGIAPPHATPLTTGGGNDLHPPSPARRRRAKEPPFIQAKGVTLTYAQAKLFGLAGGGGGGSGGHHPPPPSIAQASKIIRNATATWPRAHNSLRPNNANHGGGSSRGRAQERRPQEGRQHNHTYSPSRMEHLARPIPGRGGVNTNEEVGTTRGGGLHREVGGRAEGDFTWKRSRKAEAAMRDPACGYDFVREGGHGREEFLRRVEAYSSYSRVKIETQRAEDIYAARLDKLECPRCQNPQSYDEFSTKKLKCPGCEVAYWMPKTWNRRVWDQRNQMCAAKSEERQARIERETEEAFLTGMPRQSQHALMLRQRVGQVDFIRRMRRDLRRRRAREENRTGPQFLAGVIDDSNPDELGFRKTRPASAPIRSRARAVAAVAAAAAAAAAAAPRLATAEEGTKKLAPTATQSPVAARREEKSGLPVTLEARTVSSTEPPPPTRVHRNPPAPVKLNRDGFAAARPHGTTLPAKSNNDRLLAGPHGVTTRGNSNRDGGVVTRVGSRITSPPSVSRRPVSAGAVRTAGASGATRTTNNSVLVGTVDSLRDSGER